MLETLSHFDLVRDAEVQSDQSYIFFMIFGLFERKMTFAQIDRYIESLCLSVDLKDSNYIPRE